MNGKVRLTIDGQEIFAEKGADLIDVAREHGVYIPHLCYTGDRGKCLGTCRVCTIRWKRHYVAACVLKTEEGMELTVHTPELSDLRKGLVELLFVEGNHFCPSCEKSGDCKLQALGYRLEMKAPRFHYRFNNREIDFSADKILFEHNRCILCKRCTHKFMDDEGQRVFYFKGKGTDLEVTMSIDRANGLSDDLVDRLVALCPVGAILKKGKGFDRPYGSRKYDRSAIGTDIEE
jgi:[NiFe] hydrogenase diaphorase moiety small subunit